MDIQGLIKKDVLASFDSYNTKMSVSKVVMFFERHGIYFTKTMLQNYVRVGVLPPLLERRYYTKKHFVFLILIDSLKTVYSLDELKTLFEQVFDLDNEDDYIKILDYFNKSYNQTIGMEQRNIQDNIIKIKSDNDLKDSEEFLSILMLMSKTSATKDIAIKSIE